MAKNSPSAFKKIRNDFLRIKRVFDIIVPLFPIAFLIYSLIAGMGFLWANVITLSLSVAHYIFHVVVLFQTREDKELKQTVKIIYKTCVHFVKILTLAVSIYGLRLSISSVDLLSLVLTILSLLGWLFQVTLDVIIYSITNSIKFLKESFRGKERQKTTAAETLSVPSNTENNEAKPEKKRSAPFRISNTYKKK